MGIDKAEIKILTANDIGASMEDQLEAAQRAEHQYEGGRIALVKAEKNMNHIFEALKKDLEEGKLEPKDLELNDAQAVHDLIKRWLAKPLGMLDNMKEVERNAQLGAAGMVKGIKNCMTVPMKIMEAERNKMEAVKQAIEEGRLKEVDGDLVDTREPSRRPEPKVPGARPADPLAAVRARGASSKSNGELNGKAKKAKKKTKAKKTKAGKKKRR